MTSEEAVVDAMYAAIFSGDVEGALSWCHPDAMWHGLTSAPIGGDLEMREYINKLPDGISSMRDYALESVERDVIDGLVVSRVRSTHGSGVMVFRVADGLISDIWVISSKGRDSAEPF